MEIYIYIVAVELGNRTATAWMEVGVCGEGIAAAMFPELAAKKNLNTACIFHMTRRLFITPNSTAPKAPGLGRLSSPKDVGCC